MTSNYTLEQARERLTGLPLGSLEVCNPERPRSCLSTSSESIAYPVVLAMRYLSRQMRLGYLDTGNDLSEAGMIGCCLIAGLETNIMSHVMIVH